MISLVESFSIVFWFFLIATAVYLFYKSYNQDDENLVNHYELALKAIIEGKSRLAIDFLKETIRKDSSNIDAYVQLGNILREEGAVNQAIKVHKDLTLRSDLEGDSKYNVHLALAKDLVLLKKDELALPHLKQVLKIRLNDAFANIELLRIYEKQEMYADAFALLKSNAEKNDEKNIKLSMFKVLEGHAKADENKEKDARILFKEALKIEAKNEVAMILIGDSYQREGRMDDAINVWLKCANEIPEKAHFVFERLEKGWFDSGEFFKLEEFYKSLTIKKKKSAHAVIALAEILAKKGDIDAGIEECKAYLEQDPEHSLVEAYYLRLLIGSKQNKSAVNEISSFLDKHFISKLELFECSNCGNSSDEPQAKCPSCGSWGAYK